MHRLVVKTVVFVAKDIIRENEELARKLRSLYDKYKVKVFEFLGGPGSGKTSIIERLLEHFVKDFSPSQIAYIGGDVATSLDSKRIEKYGIRTVQVNTGGTCHLEVPHVEAALERLGGEEALREIKYLFIENVGNIICPFNFPLGAHARIMVADVAEGEDKFVKHPLSTRVSDIIVINKVDIASAINVNIDKLVKDAKMINPRAPILLVSAKTGEGIGELYKLLLSIGFKGR